MQHVRRCVAPLVLALAAALAASACGDGAVNRDSGVISIGIAEPKFLIPSSTTETEGHEVLSALFAPLVEYDAQFRPYEVAAASITTTDNRVWTIALQPGWTFHNGEPVTADSYLNAWNAGAYGPNAHDGNYFYDKIEGYADLNPIDASQPPAAKKLSGVTKRDDLTFEVTLGAPYVNFKSMLGYTAFLPLPLAAFEDVDNNVLAASYNESPIGQGPFKMKGVWRHDQVIETERFEDFQGPKVPSITGVQFRIYQQLTTMYQDMLAGQLDVVRRVPAEYIASAAADLGDRFIQSPASSCRSRPSTRSTATPPSAALSPWRLTARRSCRRSSRDPRRRFAPSSRRLCPVTGRTPAGRPASSGRRRPARCSIRRAARPPSTT